MATPVTRVFLVRHGATVLSAEDRFAGAIDVALSDEGRMQARRLGERLRGERVAAAYASPLQRARETAEIVGAPHGLEVAFPEEMSAWEADPFTFAPRGGETGLAVTARALPALVELVGRHAGETVLLVSHKATIRLLLSSLLGFDPRRYRDNLDQLPAALNIVDFRGASHARLMLFNDASHYAALPAVPTQRLSPVWDTDEAP